MRKIAPHVGYGDVEQPQQAEAFKPLTRSEAQALRDKHRALSPWVVLSGQAIVGFVAAAIAWWLTGLANVAWSVLYGAAAVVIPSALFARGLMSKVSLINPAAAVTGFFLWELVKVGLIVAMLFAAPKLVADLSWPAMLVGLVVTMKVVWLMLWVHAKAQRKPEDINVV